MATRFGGVSPAHSYATRVRWLVAGLVGIILLLIFFVIYIAQAENDSAEVVEQIEEQIPVQQPDPIGSNVEIVVSAQRIEEGTMLQDYMFRPKPWEQDGLPEGAILWQEIETIRGKYSREIINANIPVTLDNITPNRPVSQINIPPGYRAVSIVVDRRSGVEGFAKPNSRVDVLFTYTDRTGRQKVATIVRFTKVLSVGGMTSLAEGQGTAPVGDQTTVSLLVTEKDAKKIELARSLGALSLSLVGDQEPVKNQNSPESIGINDLLGLPDAKPEKQEEIRHDGVMYAQDPKTGKTKRYLLINGRWKLDQGFSFGSN